MKAPLIALGLGLAASFGWPAEPSPAQAPYPLWDGKESVADYARKTDLPPTKTLDLGNGVTMEFVLIPAGEFIMGTPAPVAPDEVGMAQKIIVGKALAAASIGVLLVMVCVIVIRAIRGRHRPQYSLARFLVMMLVLGADVLGATQWYLTSQRLAQEKAEYAAALARYRVADRHEKPDHHVKIAAPFYMGRYEVTQTQYVQLVGTNPSEYRGAQKPVQELTWHQAKGFCTKLGQRTGTAAQLPSEAQWEYACRAGTTTAYYSGDTEADLARVAWYGCRWGNDNYPVGQKEPNAFGLYDMHGNAAEWCEDDWHDGYSGAPADGSPWVDQPRGRSRIKRGGSSDFDPSCCRSAGRDGNLPDWPHGNYGFRVMLPPSPRTP